MQRCQGIVVETWNIDLILAQEISYTLVSRKLSSGTNHSSVCWETERCRGVKELLLILAIYIDYPHKRSTIPCYCKKLCLEQSPIMHIGKKRGTDCREWLGFLLRLTIHTQPSCVIDIPHHWYHRPLSCTFFFWKNYKFCPFGKREVQIILGLVVETFNIYKILTRLI